MQAQQSINTRPRRAAATAAKQKIKQIAQAQQRQPLPAIVADPAEEEQDITKCPLCTQPITRDEEVERCQACLTWVHHACIQPLIEAFDWRCRGLCGHPDVHQARVQCPLANCNGAFRLHQQANEARWLAIFNTRMWRRYARRPHVNIVLHPPPIARGNQWYNDRLRPRPEWWVARNVNVSANLERRVMDPHTPGIPWNQPGQPKWLLQQSYDLFSAWTAPNANLALSRFFGHQKFFIQPRLPIPHDSRFQRYAFTDLNVLIHGNRRVWKRMCKYYDDHGITIADFQNM